MQSLFPATVYLLCFLTSFACAVLLLRSYRASLARLLLWSGLCFLLLAVTNNPIAVLVFPAWVVLISVFLLRHRRPNP